MSSTPDSRKPAPHDLRRPGDFLRRLFSLGRAAPPVALKPAGDGGRAAPPPAPPPQGLVQAAISAHGGGDPTVASFLGQFFANAAPDDVARHTPDQLAALAAVVWNLSRTRKAGQSLVRVYNPTREAEGWTAEDTVLVAVNDDKPFLLDSLLAALNDRGLHVRTVFHPVIRVRRDGTGRRLALLAAGESAADATAESLIHIAFRRVGDAAERASLEAEIVHVLGDVANAVADWRKMLTLADETVAELARAKTAASAEEQAEAVAFLTWLKENHYTFLGVRDYVFAGDATTTGELKPVDASGLGILRDPERRVLRRGANRAALTPEVRAYLRQPSPLIIAKAATRSAVHRRVHMDYIGVKRFDSAGRLTGERRFVGLFTSSAYSRQASETPVLRRKVSEIVARAGFAAASHDGKALVNILETYPRDELFQATTDELFATAMGILYLGERPQTKAFLRFDAFDRFASALVFVPRERYTTDLRLRIGALLAARLNGHVSDAYPNFGDSPLARIHYIVALTGGHRPAVDDAALQDDIAKAARNWPDALAAALDATLPEHEAYALAQRYAHAFGAGYEETTSPEAAMRDIETVEALLAVNPPEGEIAVRAAVEGGGLHFKVVRVGGPAHLSDVLPLFEAMGLRVVTEASHPLTLKTAGGEVRLTLQDFRMLPQAELPAAAVAERLPALEDAFLAVWHGAAESDGLNRLILGAGLAWREVAVLRGYLRFLRQTGISFSNAYMEGALARNADVARLIVQLFAVRFDPDAAPDLAARKAADEAVRARIAAALKDVASADDDRILRRFVEAVTATVRTTAFQTGADHRPKPHIAFKIASRELSGLPEPRPLYEIFVYAPDVEGVHLRFGMVARGGIRWSDRREDFRTEILGLVKAQQVKNAVIVPVGSKGGFYPKRLPAAGTREAVNAEGVRAYKVFIGALLDLTDNIAGGAIQPPPRVVRHDGDDPYLVVAADKGTATFSDTANAIAVERGFWLGDAFASGGSAGYDHKKMGITARGAWETVKRHFREMGKNTQTDPFTVVGVGDMSGDVFGNGMLLSRTIKLVAAFDHRHIFVDPDPQTELSWRERKRLFDLPRSSWADYDAALVSKGGGVFARNAKSIPLSTEIQTLTGLKTAEAAPQELMRALLKTPVDLLWFGGIGTFVKAATQSNADAGDRANDEVRINGAEVRARVIGEGANLGFTQAGRIEYARHGGPSGNGGRINTDAIDNSAGVDTSDHEVNLKILLNVPMAAGRLRADERNTLLAQMTDDVARLVLQDNYDQSLALTIAELTATRDLDAHGRVMRALERRGRLDRGVEGLPSDDALRELAQRRLGLTRPELAVVLAYAKIVLFDDLIASSVPDDPFFAAELAAYFPDAAARRFAGDLPQHRLRREIVATVLANRTINMGGPAFVQRLEETTGQGAAAIVRASAIARGAFSLDDLWRRTHALDGRVDTRMQTGIYAEIIALLRRQTLWMLVNLPPEADIAAAIATFRAGVDSLRGTFASLVTPVEAQAIEARIAELQQAGLDLQHAEDVAILLPLAATSEVVALAQGAQVSVDRAAGAYFAMGATVGIDRLRHQAGKITASEHWDRLAISRIQDDLYGAQRALAAKALASGKNGAGGRAEGKADVAAWAQGHAGAVERVRAFLAELERTGDLTIAKLTLAATQIRELMLA